MKLGQFKSANRGMKWGFLMPQMHPLWIMELEPVFKNIYEMFRYLGLKSDSNTLRFISKDLNNARVVIGLNEEKLIYLNRKCKLIYKDLKRINHNVNVIVSLLKIMTHILKLILKLKVCLCNFVFKDRPSSKNEILSKHCVRACI